jgi:hypothetical protein
MLEEIKFTRLTPPEEYLKALHTMHRLAHEGLLDASEWWKLNETLLDIRRSRRWLKAA